MIKAHVECLFSLNQSVMSSCEGEMVWLVQFCLLLFLNSPVVLGHQQVILQSAEFRLRNDLFNVSFKMVRPVLQPLDVVNVNFDVELKALTEVNNRDQVITTDTIITQKWNNPFLRWNPDDYDGIQKILVDPNEIWVPDIVLENNADDEVVQAGHLEKFRSWVLLNSDGNNTWLSPATFKSTCTIDVQFFPFDKQRCDMVFRSLTSDSSMLNIDTKTIHSENPEEDLRLSTSNGYWTLRSIDIRTGEYKNSRDQTFREVNLSFFIGRRPTHFVIFSIVPCMIIGMLVLVSFFIPAESGERIGLCATILLAVSVYLLVVTEQLPEQSETLPLIGVYYIVIMFEIGLALAATVLVLMAHHATSEPPRFLTYITVLNSIRCRKKKKRKGVTIGSSTTSKADVQNADATLVTNDNVELGEMGEQTPAADLPTQQRPSTSTASSVVQLFREEEDENQETWKEIARALDRIFFWLFLVLFVVSSIVVYGQAGRLKSIDKFHT